MYLVVGSHFPVYVWKRYIICPEYLFRCTCHWWGLRQGSYVGSCWSGCSTHLTAKRWIALGRPIEPSLRSKTDYCRLSEIFPKVKLTVVGYSDKFAQVPMMNLANDSTIMTLSRSRWMCEGLMRYGSYRWWLWSRKGGWDHWLIGPILPV